MKTGKRPPQSHQEMVTEAKARKNTRTYKMEHTEMSDLKIQETVSRSKLVIDEIANTIATRPRLVDYETILPRVKAYAAACEEAGVLQTWGGLSRSMGYSINAFNTFMKAHPDHPTTELLRIIKDLYCDDLQECARNGAVSAIPAIFEQKTRYEQVEATRVEVAVDNNPLGQEVQPTEIAEKYRLLEEAGT